MKRFIAVGALIGLLVPALFLLAHAWGGYIFGVETVVVWPSSIWLMALDSAPPPSIATTLEFWAISVSANAILYALLGLLTFGIWRLAQVGYFARAAIVLSGGTALLAAWVVFAVHL